MLLGKNLFAAKSEYLQRDVYVKLPKMIENDETMVYKLKKPLYGLTDAGRQFYKKLTKIFENETNYNCIEDLIDYLFNDVKKQIPDQIYFRNFLILRCKILF